MVSVETELRKATKIATEETVGKGDTAVVMPIWPDPPAPGEPNRQEYLRGLAFRAGKMENVPFYKLSQETQAWANAAVKAYKSNLTVNELPGAEPAKREEREDTMTTKTTKATRKTAPKKAAKKAVKKAPAVKTTKLRGRAAGNGQTVAAAPAEAPAARERRSLAVDRARTPVKPGSVLHTIQKRMTRAKGIKRAELLAEIKWKAISMQQQAEALGLKLTVRKEGKSNRYFATPI